MRSKITKHHQTYVRKIDERGPKMAPKPWQNRSWRGSGGLLGATLETRCFQEFMFDDFGSILVSPLDQFELILGIIFLNVFFRSGFLMGLASIWAPKTLPKWDSIWGAKTNTWKSSILDLFPTLWPHSRVLNIIFFCCFFGTLFWDGFGSPFLWFWLTCGLPFGNIFCHFWGTIFASIFRPPKSIELQSLMDTISPLLGLLLPS